MPFVYELRHMFPAELSGGEKVFFTRDNQHRLGELPKAKLDHHIEQGHVVKTEVTAAQYKEIMAGKEVREPTEVDVVGEVDAQQPNRDAAEARGVKAKRGS